MEELNKNLDDLLDYIKNTHDYKMCVKLKEQMNDNKDLMKLIGTIKTLQKKYIMSNYDEKLKKELDTKKDELFEVPIYVIYNTHLSNVNYMIDYIKDSLNDYFYKLLNKEN